MRKGIVLICLFCIAATNTMATIFTVTVSNFQFSPSNIPNVVVGDVIHWVLSSGNHTTTCNPATQGAGNSLPAGAAPWDAPINFGATTFDYTVTKAGIYNYWCKIHAPGMAGSFTAVSPAPVTLSMFQVSAANNSAFINWQTQAELNVNYFSVQRSNDGSFFTEIGRVQPAGSANGLRSYNFTDNAVPPTSKYVYYLLSTIDLDGSKHNSDVRIYKNIHGAAKLITSLSPNPITKPGHLMLKFNADKPGEMIVNVFNSSGKNIMQLHMSAVTGVNNGHIHMGDVPPGTYSILFNLDDMKETYKVVVK